MEKVSKNLSHCRFVRIAKSSKRPIDPGWQDMNCNITEANKWIEEGYNVGLLCDGDYIAFDCDHRELQDAIEKYLPRTYEQRSGGRKMPHFIYRMDGEWRTNVTFLHEESPTDMRKQRGQLLSYHKQILIYPSRVIPIGETYPSQYTIIRDMPPTTISMGQLFSLMYYLRCNTFMRKWGYI